MAAPSPSAVREWTSRVDDVAEAVREILSADPLAEHARRQEREARRQEAQAAAEQAHLQKVKRRYEPRYYGRYERDDVIDALLKEADESSSQGSRGVHSADRAARALYSKADALSLELALKAKAAGAEAVKALDWAAAHVEYTNAIGLLKELEDDEVDLLVALHNNRSLVRNKLRDDTGSIEDATYVLRHDPRNVKALMRRGLALRHARRPTEALRDMTAALKYEPSNPEAAAQRAWLRRAEAELAQGADFANIPPSSSLSDPPPPPARLRHALDRLAESLKAADAVSRDGVEVEWATCTRTIAAVVQAHRGASALLVTGNGIPSLMRVAEIAGGAMCVGSLSNKATDSEVWITVLIQTLSALTWTWQECPCTGAEGVEAAELTRVTGVLGQVLSATVRDEVADNDVPRQGATAAGDRSTTTQLLLRVLVCRLLEYLTVAADVVGGDVVAEAFSDAQPRSAVHLADALKSLWLSTQRTAEAPASPSTEATRCYYLVGLLEALTRFALHSDDLSSAGEHGAAVRALVRAALFQPLSTPHATTAPLLEVVMCAALRVGSPGALLCRGASLALSISAAAPPDEPHTGPRAGADDRTALEEWRRVRDEVQGPAFGHVVEQSLRACLSSLPSPRAVFLRPCRQGTAPPEAAQGAEEGQSLVESLCALLYNALVSRDAAARAEYWAALHASYNADTPTLASRLLESALEPAAATSGTAAMAGMVPTPAAARAWGVVSKTLAADHALLTSLSSSASSMSRLWQWLSCVAQVVAAVPVDSPTQASVVSTGWELAVHMTTMLAMLHSASSCETVSPPVNARLEVLCALIRAAQCPGTVVVEGLLLGTTSRTESAVASSQVVALGNAALLLSQLAAGSAHREDVAAAAVASAAVNTALLALRAARTASQELAHEAAKKAVEASPGLRKTVSTWQKHTTDAMRNLSVALSKLCLLDEKLKDELRELNGFETLAAVQRNM